MANNRFVPEIFNHTKMKIRDTANGKFVGFSFSNPPKYEGDAVETVWSNPIAAHNFADRLARLNTDKPDAIDARREQQRRLEEYRGY